MDKQHECTIAEAVFKYGAPLPRTHIELEEFVKWCDEHNIPIKQYYRQG